MLVFYTVKPEFATNDAVATVNNFYLTPENKFQVLCEGFICGVKDGGECCKKYMPFSDKTMQEVCGNGIYAIVGDYSGTEKEWRLVRGEIENLLKEGGIELKNSDGNKGGKQNVALDEDVHLSEGYELATKEVCEFIKLMQNYAKNQVKLKNYQMADDAMSQIEMFAVDVDTREDLYKAVKEVEKKTEKKLTKEQSQEVGEALKQLKTVSKVADKACKDLKKDHEKIKWQYIK